MLVVDGAILGPEKVDAIAEMVGDMDGDLVTRARFADVAVLLLRLLLLLAETALGE